MLQDQQFTSGEWELSTRESLKTVVTIKMWYEPSEQLKRQGTFYIGSQRLDLHHPITEHKRISPHINLSFLPPLIRKQDASARLSIGLIPRSIPLWDTESPQPTHPHFKTALGKIDFNLSLWILELIKKKVVIALLQSSHCWCYCHILVVTSGTVYRSLLNSRLWVRFGNQQSHQQRLLAVLVCTTSEIRKS